jgi:hypothetical protein
VNLHGDPPGNVQHAAAFVGETAEAHRLRAET